MKSLWQEGQWPTLSPSSLACAGGGASGQGADQEPCPQAGGTQPPAARARRMAGEGP